MTRHNIRGKRIVLEDASLAELVQAREEIVEIALPRIRSQMRSYSFNTSYDIERDRELARRYANAIGIEKDLVNEIDKRTTQRRWQ